MSPAPARRTASLRARVLSALLRLPPHTSLVLVAAAAGCQAPAAIPPARDPETPATLPVSSSVEVARAPAPATSDATASAPPPAMSGSAAPPPVTTSVAARPPAAEREDPTACASRVTQCYPPRQPTSGGKVVQRELHWDRNGCLPKAETAGACAAFFPTSGPRFTGGQCCYEGCAGPLIKCGRPLLRGAAPVVSTLVLGTAWSTPS